MTLRAEQQAPLISSLVGAVISSKTSRLIESNTGRVVEQLCRSADPEQQLRNEPGVRQALWNMVADGRFHEQTPQSDVKQFVFAVRFIAQAVEPLLEGERPHLPAGVPSQAHKRLKLELLAELETNATCAELRNDKVFKAYINRMSNLLVVLQVPLVSVQSNEFVRTRMLEVLAAEYLLFKDSELPASLMKGCAHRRSVFKVQELYKAARDHPDLGSIAKTAARLVLVGSYDDLAAVAKQYQKILRQVETVVGGTPELAAQATSIAGDVLNRTIPSVEYAKSRLTELGLEAEQLAGEYPRYKTIQGSLVAAAYPRRKWHIEDARKVYDKAYDELKAAAQAKDREGLSPHGGAFDVLRGLYPSAGAYLAAFDRHRSEYNAFFPPQSPYYGLKGTITDGLMSRRLTSAKDVREHLDSLTAELHQKMGENDYQFPQSPILWALLRNKFADIDSALTAYAAGVVACRAEFQRVGIESERYLQKAAKYVFLGFYKNVDQAVSALAGHIERVGRYLQDNPDKRSKEEELVVQLFTMRRKLGS